MALAKKSILIVDDMKTVRYKLKQICSELGIKNVYEAEDGKQALEMLTGLQVDLILSDWNMPEMTGIQMVEQIRKSPALKDIPVIFITSEDQKSAIIQSVLSGVSDYIVKPFPDAIVKQKILSKLKTPAE